MTSGSNGVAESNIADVGLVYVTDAAPGIRRVRQGDAFVYLLPDG
jgi:DNA topoisomerase IB